MTPARYKIARKLRGTQAEVAKLLGVSRVSVVRRESGARPVSKEAWLALGALAKKGNASGKNCELYNWRKRAENAARAHQIELEKSDRIAAENLKLTDALQKIAARNGGQFGLLLAHELAYIAKEALANTTPSRKTGQKGER